MRTISVQLSICKDDREHVNKELLQEKTVSCTIKEDTAEDTPLVFVSKTAFDKNYNYAYIAEFGRYYFVKPPLYQAGGVVELSMESDPLMSFKSDLLELEVVVARNENIKNGYLVDNNFKAYAYDEVQTFAFPNAMENDSVILMTMG